MQSPPELLSRVCAAIDDLQAIYGVDSDRALAGRLKADGWRVSTHILWLWRTGQWTEADTLLVAMLIAPDRVSALSRANTPAESAA
ncbi:MAG TPA: hypothetical protein VFT99_13130 [Roseiflexaceae bacterium]|nr:hypothetical protein [Roseiflexaceae bacterium]